MNRTSSDSCFYRSPQPRSNNSRPADLIVTNARIYTVDEAHPLADAMAVRGGKVQFVGSSARRHGAAWARPRASIDLGGRTVIPGMVDAHGHVDNLGLALAHRRPHRHDVVRRGHRARRRAREEHAGRSVDHRPRLGSERLGRHALPDARKAVRARFRTTRCTSRASMATRASPTRRRCKAAGVTAQTKDPERRPHRARRERLARRRVRRQRAGSRGARHSAAARATKCKSRSARPRSPRRRSGGSPACTTPARRAQMLDIYEELGESRHAQLPRSTR